MRRKGWHLWKVGRRRRRRRCCCCMLCVAAAAAAAAPCVRLLPPPDAHPSDPPLLFLPTAPTTQCFRCGGPRWDGPGWQLEQRLAGALQAGAALSHALLQHGGDAPAAAAAAATAALARFQWEAGEAGAAAQGSAPPDAHASGSLGEHEHGGGAALGGAAAAATAAAAVALPSFDAEDEFRSLAELAGRMLADSCECGCC